MGAADMSLYKRYQFFKDHAGYRVGYRAIGALALARAEESAEDNDMEFVWCEDYDDYDSGLGDHEYWCAGVRRERYENKHELHQESRHSHEVYWCVARWNGATQASLGAIIDPDSDYRRVVEAELALEAKFEANKGE